jgi:PAS domain S-box-containing protein
MLSSPERRVGRGALSFLDGGGEMGALMRAHHWAASSIGPPQNWPQALRTSLRLLLNTGHPMYIFWGPEGACFYNDAYRLSIGPERHPGSLGQPARAVWEEIWPVIGPQIEQVMSGGVATWHVNQFLPITRNGKLEDVYWTYSYSPIDDDTSPNGVGGVLVVCTETTEAVLSKAAADQAHERLAQMFEQGPSFVAMLEGPSHRFTLANAAYMKLVGDRPILGLTIAEALPDAVEQGYLTLLDSVFQSGETFSSTGARYLVEATPGQPGDERFVDFVYQPVRDAAGNVSGIFVEGVDATQRTLAEAALRESEERLQRALSTGNGVGTWDWDVPNDRVVSDERFARLYGVDPVVARAGAPIATFFRSMHPDDVAGLQASIAQVLAAGGDFFAEYRLMQPDGAERWVAAQGRCQLGPDGKPLRFPGVSFDITDRKLAEMRSRALFELDDRFRELDDPADLAFAAAEALGRALEVSRAGYGTIDPVAETITIERDWNAPGIRSLAGVLNFRDYGSYIEDLKRGVTVAISDAGKDPRTRADAEALKAISAQSFVNMPLTEQGGFVALLYLNHATARDWTEAELALMREVAARTRAAVERRRAEAALRTSEDNFRMLARAMPNQAWTSAPDGLLDWFNERVYAYSGAADGTLDGQGWASMVHPDDLPDAGARWAEALQSGETYETEFRLRRHDGAFRWHIARAVPIRTPAGDVSRWIGTNTDIHDQKEATRGLADLAATLEQRVEERTSQLMAAEEALRQSQKMEAVGQLTGGIAHDFNNLLTGITGSLDLLERRIGEGRLSGLERYTNAAQSSARRAASLTQRLLAFSRRQTLDPKPTDVNRLISNMAELIRRTVGPAIPVEVVEAGGLWLTRIDPSQLENALLNLSINARDAMPDGGRITIETANKWLDERAARERELPPGQYISVCVTDTGTGMTPEVITRAFDPFFTTKPIGQGTGLGLSMIHGFVRQSGGQVRIYSEVGSGTTVCLYLPRYVGELEAIDTPAPALPADAGRGETVLVIDDEVMIRMLMVEVLSEAGYRVIEAGDGPSGLKLLNSDIRIDLLITDVGLPGGINGRQVADAARARRPGLKVLFITGYAENAVVGNGHLEPGMAVVTKPFEINAIAGRVRDLIEG